MQLGMDVSSPSTQFQVLDVDIARAVFVQVPIQDIGIAYGQLDRVSAERLEEHFSDDGQMVALVVTVPAAQAENLQEALADASSGRIVWETELKNTVGEVKVGTGMEQM